MDAEGTPSEGWKIVEFEAYKQHQVRTRTLKSRKLTLELQRAPEIFGPRAIIRMAIALAVLAVGVVIFKTHFSKVWSVVFADRQEFKVAEAAGSASVETSKGKRSSATAGEKLAGAFRVEQDDESARTTLTNFWNGRIVLLNKANVEFAALNIKSDQPDASHLKLVLKSGVVMFELTEGDPLIELDLPQKCKAFGGLGRYKFLLEKDKVTVLVRDGFVRVQAPETKKSVKVEADQQLVVADGQWDKPIRCATPEILWH